MKFFFILSLPIGILIIISGGTLYTWEYWWKAFIFVLYGFCFFYLFFGSSLFPTLILKLLNNGGINLNVYQQDCNYYYKYYLFLYSRYRMPILEQELERVKYQILIKLTIKSETNPLPTTPSIDIQEERKPRPIPSRF